jgi:hypothetical protein
MSIEALTKELLHLPPADFNRISEKFSELSAQVDPEIMDRLRKTYCVDEIPVINILSSYLTAHRSDVHSIIE